MQFPVMGRITLTGRYLVKITVTNDYVSLISKHLTVSRLETSQNLSEMIYRGSLHALLQKSL